MKGNNEAFYLLGLSCKYVKSSNQTLFSNFKYICLTRNNYNPHSHTFLTCLTLFFFIHNIYHLPTGYNIYPIIVLLLSFSLPLSSTKVGVILFCCCFCTYILSTKHYLRYNSMSSMNILLNRRMSEIPFPNNLLTVYILHNSIQLCSSPLFF